MFVVKCKAKDLTKEVIKAWIEYQKEKKEKNNG